MRQAGQARAAGRKARSAGPHAAAAERPGGAGNIFAPCVISGSSTRKGPLAARFARHVSRIARLRPEMDAWGEDVAILISKSMHFGRMLPGRGPFSRIRRKRDACGAVLASQGPGAAATRGERWGGDADVGARWVRCGRRSATRIRRRRRTMVVMGGAMSAESARWRHRGMRMAARSGVDAMRATACGGRDADEASPMGAGGSGAVLR